MSQLYTVGRVTTDIELKTSARQNVYLRFTLAERIGFGDSTRYQYIQVWAWGHMAQQLIKQSVRKGCMIWVSGNLELEEFVKSDGKTRDKRLKLKLNEWGIITENHRPEYCSEHFGVTPEAECSISSPTKVIDGDREPLPE